MSGFFGIVEYYVININFFTFKCIFSTVSSYNIFFPFYVLSHFCLDYARTGRVL